MKEMNWKDYLAPLESVSHDVEAIRKAYIRKKAEIAVKNLKKNQFEACYADNRAEAAECLIRLIPDGAIIGCGDSHTLFALHLEEALKEKNCTVIPHSCISDRHSLDNRPEFRTKAEAQAVYREILRHYLVSDVFLLGANAVTIDGQIVNMDGRGNRIAGSLYGPERIIVLAGANKLVPDVEAARKRIGFVAAPMNHVKYQKDDMPCMKAGTCLDCRSAERSCSISTVIHRKPHDADFHVILIGEELGF